jgi:hypothetical protein
MKELQEMQDVLVLLGSVFGSIISLLLVIIGWMIARWSKRLDIRLDTQDNDIGDLQKGYVKHETEIKNLHLRLKEAKN